MVEFVKSRLRSGEGIAYCVLLSTFRVQDLGLGLRDIIGNITPVPIKEMVHPSMMNAGIAIGREPIAGRRMPTQRERPKIIDPHLAYLLNVFA